MEHGLRVVSEHDSVIGVKTWSISWQKKNKKSIFRLARLRILKEHDREKASKPCRMERGRLTRSYM